MTLETVSETVRKPLLKPGTRICLCRTCGARFSGERNFDRHRVGPWDDRRCLPVSRMSEAGMVLDSRGIWIRPKVRKPDNVIHLEDRRRRLRPLDCPDCRERDALISFDAEWLECYRCGYQEPFVPGDPRPAA